VESFIVLGSQKKPGREFSIDFLGRALWVENRVKLYLTVHFFLRAFDFDGGFLFLTACVFLMFPPLFIPTCWKGSAPLFYKMPGVDSNFFGISCLALVILPRLPRRVDQLGPIYGFFFCILMARIRFAPYVAALVNPCSRSPSSTFSDDDTPVFFHHALVFGTTPIGTFF